MKNYCKACILDMLNRQLTRRFKLSIIFHRYLNLCHSKFKSPIQLSTLTYFCNSSSNNHLIQQWLKLFPEDNYFNRCNYMWNWILTICLNKNLLLISLVISFNLIFITGVCQKHKDVRNTIIINLLKKRIQKLKSGITIHKLFVSEAIQ